MAGSFQTLKYLYVGSKDVGADLAYYLDVLGATLVWDYSEFGTRVAAVDTGAPTITILAGHRHAPSVLPVYIVEDLAATVKTLEKRGWNAKEGPFGIPDGDCYLFVDPSGNEVAFFENQRPDALTHEWRASQAERQ